MSNNKLKTLHLLDILKEYSDIDNILSMSDIKSKMHLIYGETIDRRTVYDSIEIFNLLGFSISDYDDNGKGYYIEDREFESGEIRLLMDSVYLNNAVSAKQTVQLIKKLQKFMSKSKRKQYQNLLINRDTTKTINQEVFLTIEELDEAITNGKQVEFNYMKYNYLKELVPRIGEKYLVNPYAMVVVDGEYYLICGYTQSEKINSYVISKIKNINQLQKSFDKPSNLDVQEIVRNSTLMFSGSPISVVIRCHNRILDHIITRFGKDILITDNGDDTFNATIKGTENGVIIWATHFIDSCEILEPLALRERIIQKINSNWYKK